jgi:hypothetical protein
MRNFFLIIAVIAFVSIFPFDHLFAQDAPAPSELFEEKSVPNKIEEEPQKNYPDTLLQEKPQKQKPLFEKYSDIPQEALDDMNDFHEYCNKDILVRQHYDCDCLSATYLDQRIKEGPIADRSVVMSKIMEQCVSVSAAAAYGYERCQGYGSMNYDGGMEPEEYCACVGNNYALLLKQSGYGLSGRMMRSFMTSATLRCQTPTSGGSNLLPRLDIKK